MGTVIGRKEMSGQSISDALEYATKEFRATERELEQLTITRQQLLTQKYENDMVLQELGLVGSDAQVYKLVGPVMVKKSTEESIGHVKTRLELITRESDRVEAKLKEVEQLAMAKKQKVGQLQQVAKAQA